MDTIEKEISRLMLKNGGQLYIFEQFERNKLSKYDMKSGGYFSDDDIFNDCLQNFENPILMDVSENCMIFHNTNIVYSTICGDDPKHLQIS